MVKFDHILLFITNTKKVKIFDWFTTPYKGENGQNMNGIVQLPFPCSCRPNVMPLDNLQTHWFYTSYIPLQTLMCIHRITKKGSQKIPRGELEH